MDNKEYYVIATTEIYIEEGLERKTKIRPVICGIATSLKLAQDMAKSFKQNIPMTFHEYEDYHWINNEKYPQFVITKIEIDFSEEEEGEE